LIWHDRKSAIEALSSLDRSTIILGPRFSSREADAWNADEIATLKAGGKRSVLVHLPIACTGPGGPIWHNSWKDGGQGGSGSEAPIPGWLCKPVTTEKTLRALHGDIPSLLKDRSSWPEALRRAEENDEAHPEYFDLPTATLPYLMPFPKDEQDDSESEDDSTDSHLTGCQAYFHSSPSLRDLRYPVHYWDQDWQDRYLSEVEKYLKLGFDGIYLTGLSAHVLFESSRGAFLPPFARATALPKNKTSLGLTPKQALADWVGRIFDEGVKMLRRIQLDQVIYRFSDSEDDDVRDKGSTAKQPSGTNLVGQSGRKFTLVAADCLHLLDHPRLAESISGVVVRQFATVPKQAKYIGYGNNAEEDLIELLKPLIEPKSLQDGKFSTASVYANKIRPRGAVLLEHAVLTPQDAGASIVALSHALKRLSETAQEHFFVPLVRVIQPRKASAVHGIPIIDFSSLNAGWSGTNNLIQLRDALLRYHEQTTMSAVSAAQPSQALVIRRKNPASTVSATANHVAPDHSQLEGKYQPPSIRTSSRILTKDSDSDEVNSTSKPMTESNPEPESLPSAKRYIESKATADKSQQEREQRIDLSKKKTVSAGSAPAVSKFKLGARARHELESSSDEEMQSSHRSLSRPRKTGATGDQTSRQPVSSKIPTLASCSHPAEDAPAADTKTNDLSETDPDQALTHIEATLAERAARKAAKAAARAAAKAAEKAATMIASIGTEETSTRDARCRGSQDVRSQPKTPTTSPAAASIASFLTDVPSSTLNVVCVSTTGVEFDPLFSTKPDAPKASQIEVNLEESLFLHETPFEDATVESELHQRTNSTSTTTRSETPIFPTESKYQDPTVRNPLADTLMLRTALDHQSSERARLLEQQRRIEKQMRRKPLPGVSDASQAQPRRLTQATARTIFHHLRTAIQQHQLHVLRATLLAGPLKDMPAGPGLEPDALRARHRTGNKDSPEQDVNDNIADEDLPPSLLAQRRAKREKQKREEEEQANQQGFVQQSTSTGPHEKYLRNITSPIRMVLSAAEPADGTTLLHFAASRGDVAALSLLLQALRESPPSPSSIPANNKSRRGRNAEEDVDPEATAIVNMCDALNRTPLFLACAAGSEFCIAKLLEARSNPLIADAQGQTPLHMTARLASADCLTILVSTTAADLEAKTLISQQTPLHYAALARSAPCVLALILRRANPLAQDASKHTPLMIAAKHRSLPCVLALLDGDPVCGELEGEGQDSHDDFDPSDQFRPGFSPEGKYVPPYLAAIPATSFRLCFRALNAAVTLARRVHAENIAQAIEARMERVRERAERAYVQLPRIVGVRTLSARALAAREKLEAEGYYSNGVVATGGSRSYPEFDESGRIIEDPEQQGLIGNFQRMCFGFPGFTSSLVPDDDDDFGLNDAQQQVSPETDSTSNSATVSLGQSSDVASMNGGVGYDAYSYEEDPYIQESVGVIAASASAPRNSSASASPVKDQQAAHNEQQDVSASGGWFSWLWSSSNETPKKENVDAQETINAQDETESESSEPAIEEEDGATEPESAREDEYIPRTKASQIDGRKASPPSQAVSSSLPENLPEFLKRHPALRNQFAASESSVPPHSTRASNLRDDDDSEEGDSDDEEAFNTGHAKALRSSQKGYHSSSKSQKASVSTSDERSSTSQSVSQAADQSTAADPNEGADERDGNCNIA